MKDILLIVGEMLCIIWTLVLIWSVILVFGKIILEKIESKKTRSGKIERPKEWPVPPEKANCMVDDDKTLKEMIELLDRMGRIERLKAHSKRVKACRYSINGSRRVKRF